MPRLPDGVTWVMVFSVVTVLLGGMWFGKELADRRRLIATLELHGRTHPGDRPVVDVLVECNKLFIVNNQSCAAQLVKKFGPEVLGTLGRMGEQGAFGTPQGAGRP